MLRPRWNNVEFVSTFCNVENPMSNFASSSTSDQRYPQCRITLIYNFETKLIWSWNKCCLGKKDFGFTRKHRISISPENVRKPLVFWRFQGVEKFDTGLKWVNSSKAPYHITLNSLCNLFYPTIFQHSEISSFNQGYRTCEYITGDILVFFFK